MAGILKFGGILLVLAGVALAMTIADKASAQIQGEAVKCGCYCGVMLDPPCSEDACKSACGWQEGDSTPQSSGQGGSKSFLYVLVMTGLLLFILWLVFFGFPVPASPV